MMEKRFQSQSIETLKTASVEETIGEQPKRQKHQFPVGTKYQFNDRVWMVKRAWFDSGEQFRFIQSTTTGEESYVPLHVLQKDAESPVFVPLELTETERLLLKAQKA